MNATHAPLASGHTDTPHPAPRALSGVAMKQTKLSARWQRLTRWEFWPAAVVYAPLIPFLAWYACQSGGPTTAALCNPSIHLGGFLGESKFDILSQLPAEAIVPSALIPPGDAASRSSLLHAFVQRTSATYPIILKPDVGERGAGVRLIRSKHAAHAYLAANPAAILAQHYHPGPCEAGVFYVRLPSEPAGRIFSITDKRFPSITGDGASTLHDLIWRHPRFRLQARVFLNRLGARASVVPALGESVTLGIAGNHCRGTLFLDGRHLLTPALTQAIDAIARHAPGIFFGRFDLRYADPEEFKAGRGFRIVELNGLLSESTNIYDPSFSFWQAQAVLRTQWRLAFEIGRLNARAGLPRPRISRVWRQLLAHFRKRTGDADSD